MIRNYWLVVLYSNGLYNFKSVKLRVFVWMALCCVFLHNLVSLTDKEQTLNISYLYLQYFRTYCLNN